MFKAGALICPEAFRSHEDANSDDTGKRTSIHSANQHLQLIQASMGDVKVTKTSIGIQKDESSKHPGAVLRSFFLQLPGKLQRHLKSNLKKSVADVDGPGLVNSIWNDKRSSNVLEVNLEKQLQAWKDNPIWADKLPDVKVSVPKGSFCHLKVKVDVGLPPDAEVVSRKVLIDEGSRQVVEVEQAAMWRFLWWSGTIAVHVLVDQNRDDYSMKFKQVRTGFMKRFEGCWRVEPILLDEKLCHPFKPKTLMEYTSCTKGKGRIGSKVSLEQLIEPAIVPPPPISWYLRGITTRTTEMLITDLLAEAARIRGVSETLNSLDGLPENKLMESPLDDTCDIKERWALRRRNARQHRRLHLVEKSGTG
ncbi:hypothetical protein RJ640_016134 [Escallonia rubra]|uniref:DUF220 domain-containing protein n=1 Tax=Escallonia rubra TaxID=112253 RepID=A0AA88UD02_9ASTE|nr:hypothetical protein RJ640_016134 [Escallonia rubra]